MRALGQAITAALCLVALHVPAALGQSSDVRGYRYAAVEAVYTVWPDASMAVEETLTYAFTGTYHEGYRRISAAGTDGISVLGVTDAQTGEPLRRVGTRLDRFSPESWGAYTVYREEGDTIVEWYFDATDTTRSWIIAYDAAGVVRFGDTADELYWNIVSGLDAPADRMAATVRLPAPTSAYQGQWYRTGSATGTLTRLDAQTFRFTADRFSAGEPATFALGWDTGIVTRQAYWQSRLPSLLIGFILPFLIVLIAIVWSVRYYRRAEGLTNQVIIPEYAPPEGFVPAYAAQAVSGSVRPRDWAATVVDLAIRGAVRIEEERSPALFNLPPQAKLILKFAAACSIPILVIFLLINTMSAEGIALADLPGEALISIGLIGAIAPLILVSSLRNRRYKIVRTGAQVAFEPFEQVFLDALIPPGTSAWTQKDAMARAQEIRLQMMGAAQTVKQAFGDRFGGYERPTAGHRRAQGVLATSVFLLVAAVMVLDAFGAAERVIGAVVQIPGFPLILSIVLAAVIVATTRFILVRLSPKGEQLRDHLLGFKLYLATAERYRLQNLTPDQFEKFLPYAIVFGVEKQWAKAFAGMAVAAPAWYLAAGTPGGSAAGFSAESFASGFSASFISSFASSSGGAAGGGGSAGGGGGAR